MTGPRSRGCITCVQRRVKCDETRPLCRRCVNSKHECKGYSRPLTIVNENTRVVRTSKTRSGRKERTPNDAQLALTDNIAVSLMKRQYIRQRNGWHQQLAPMPSMLTERIFLGYLIDKVTTCQAQSIMQHDMAVLIDTAQSPTARLAVEALSGMFFGMTHSIPDVTRKASYVYSRALRSLVEDLHAPGKSLATLAAMTALTMYELLAFTTTTAWLKHGWGVTRYMQLMGPEAFKAMPARALLSQNRMMIIAQCVMCRYRPFLAEDRWKTVPWEDDVDSKEAPDHLFDIVADIACISAEVDSLKSFRRDVTRVDIKLAEIAESLKQCFSAVDAWWKDWEYLNGHKCWKVPIDRDKTLCRDETGPFLSHQLEFDTFFTCYTLMVHDAARVLLLDLQKELSDEYGLEPFPDDQPPQGVGISGLLGSCNDQSRLVDQMMSCVDFCDRQTKDYITTFCIMFPLWVAANHWEDDSRESDWMCRVCKIEDDNLIGYVAGERRISIRRMTASEEKAALAKCVP